jgi:hypothetical protein
VIFLPLIQSKNIDPSEVDFTWFNNLPPSDKAFVVFDALSTLTVNGIFQYGALESLFLIGKKEAQAFLTNKAFHPFITECLMALLAAIPGTAIAGNTFTGELQWFAKAFGFIIYFTYSFLGTHDLINSYNNPQQVIQNDVVDKLWHLNPERYRAENYWQDKTLTEETVRDFLNDVFTKAELDELIFSPTSLDEQRIQSMLHGLDNTVAAAITVIFSFIMIQSGYSGINALANNQLDSWPNGAKIAIGVPFALPLLLFTFYVSKVAYGSFGKAGAAADNSLNNLIKLSALTVLCLGCSTWGYSLGAGVARQEGIFSSVLHTPFGRYGLPIMAFLSCFISGLNGLSPMVLTTTIKTEHPEIDDVVHFLEQKNNGYLIPKVKRYGYFSPSVLHPETELQHLEPIGANPC